MADKILKFSASWCGPCQALKKTLEGADLGLPIDEVDIDNNTDIAVEYGIRSVPTMILIRDGAEVKRTSGAKTLDQIRTWIAQ